MEVVQSRKLWSKFLRANGYQLVRCIGQGSFGDVYSVKCLTTGKAWAVKRLVARHDIQEDNYAMAEIEALAYIQHPMVVGLKEILLCPRLACIVMQLAPLGNLEVLVRNEHRHAVFSATDITLTDITSRKLNSYSLDCGQQIASPKKDSLTLSNPSERIKLEHGDKTSYEASVTDLNRQGNLVCLEGLDDYLALCCSTPAPSPSGPAQAVDPSFLSLAFKQITSALVFCHDLNLAHRDVNPSNVLVFRPDLVKLADFGLCFRCRNRENTTENERNSAPDTLCADYLGRDHYTAPEVRRQEPFNAKPADVWSLGCVLYFMLQSNHPPLQSGDLLDGVADEDCQLIPAEYDVTLAKKCFATLVQACKFQINDRPTMKDILKLWNT